MQIIVHDDGNDSGYLPPLQDADWQQHGAEGAPCDCAAGGGGGIVNPISITCADLHDGIANGTLVPGQWYEVDGFLPSLDPAQRIYVQATATNHVSPHAYGRFPNLSYGGQNYLWPARVFIDSASGQCRIEWLRDPVRANEAGPYDTLNAFPWGVDTVTYVRAWDTRFNFVDGTVSRVEAVGSYISINGGANLQRAVLDRAYVNLDNSRAYNLDMRLNSSITVYGNSYISGATLRNNAGMNLNLTSYALSIDMRSGYIYLTNNTFLARCTVHDSSVYLYNIYSYIVEVIASSSLRLDARNTARRLCYFIDLRNGSSLTVTNFGNTYTAIRHVSARDAGRVSIWRLDRLYLSDFVEGTYSYNDQSDGELAPVFMSQLRLSHSYMYILQRLPLTRQPQLFDITMDSSTMSIYSAELTLNSLHMRSSTISVPLSNVKDDVSFGTSDMRHAYVYLYPESTTGVRYVISGSTFDGGILRLYPTASVEVVGLHMSGNARWYGDDLQWWNSDLKRVDMTLTVSSLSIYELRAFSTSMNISGRRLRLFNSVIEGDYFGYSQLKPASVGLSYLDIRPGAHVEIQTDSDVDLQGMCIQMRELYRFTISGNGDVHSVYARAYRPCATVNHGVINVTINTPFYGCGTTNF